jgi:hypothetical protein
MDWQSLLGFVGIGSLLTVLVQAWVSSLATKKERQRLERKEAYLGLLEAWVRQENLGFSDETLRDVGHWVLRVELVASDRVLKELRNWVSSEPGSPDRSLATEALKNAMRSDLV